jgi:hypothetical protein
MIILIGFLIFLFVIYFDYEIGFFFDLSIRIDSLFFSFGWTTFFFVKRNVPIIKSQERGGIERVGGVWLSLQICIDNRVNPPDAWN